MTRPKLGLGKTAAEVALGGMELEYRLARKRASLLRARVINLRGEVRDDRAMKRVSDG